LVYRSRTVLLKKVGIRFRKSLAQREFWLSSPWRQVENYPKLSRRTVWSGGIVFDLARNPTTSATA
jgi:hypothetical protein